MFTRINSSGIQGIGAYPVSVEADVANGLPGFSISGQLSTEVREAQERVRTALKNSGFQLPAKKITVNLSPAGVKKGGTAFDLPIAVAVLGAFGVLDTGGLGECLVIGELGLDGSVKPVPGVLVHTEAARAGGLRQCILPGENEREGRLIKGIQIIGIRSLKELVQTLARPDWKSTGQKEETEEEENDRSCEGDSVDFKEINGQGVLRRAAEVAAAGMHGLLMCGSAGTGKSMVASRIPTILPGLTREEDIEISRVYSVCGKLPSGRPLLSKRPFRSPHHTISPQGLTGGGRFPVPGEFSLASGGVLFLDELPHFGRGAIEALRQPLEDRKIMISRVWGSCEFPADFLIVGAMNPCPCGFFPDRNRCSCTEAQIQGYLRRLSRPILERFDMGVEAAPVSFRELEETPAENESSKEIRTRVERTVKIQKKRFEGTKIRFNSRMGPAEIRRFCPLGEREREFAEKVYEIRGLSARSYHKVLKTARTIADLAGEKNIRREHLAEAFGYRTLEGRLWGREKD